MNRFSFFKKYILKRYVFALVILSFLPTVPSFAASKNVRMAVESDVANIRSEPSTKGEILWKAERYYPLLILKKKGNWYYFRDFEGDQGWVHKSIIGKAATVITTGKKCNIRSRPSTKSDILFVTGKGVPFKIMKKKGKWIHIEHSDGDRGWIHQSLVW